MNQNVMIGKAAWRRACEGAAFIALKSARSRTVSMLMAIALIPYLGLAVLCGFSRDLLGTKIFGPINLGYALIFGNYVIVWVLGVYYLHLSGKTFDALASAAIKDSGIPTAELSDAGSAER